VWSYAEGPESDWQGNTDPLIPPYPAEMAIPVPTIDADLAAVTAVLGAGGCAARFRPRSAGGGRGGGCQALGGLPLACGGAGLARGEGA